jgi:membrane protein YqaA with SNARE-associated domain
MREVDKTPLFRYVVIMHEFLAANGYPALFLLNLLASTLIPLGSEWLLITLIFQGVAPLPMVLAASDGNLMGGCTSYAIGVCASTFLVSKILQLEISEKAMCGRSVGLS